MKLTPSAKLLLAALTALPFSNVNSELIGWWKLDEGSGVVAADSSGNKATLVVANPETGGLGDDGSAWVTDEDRGPVLAVNGEDGTGAYAGGFALPVLTLENDFSWAFWARSDQAPNNDIIFGNRYDADGAEFAPREFIKFTTSQFEWHVDGAGQNIDYDDVPEGDWVHHAVVKSGATITYFRDGAEAGSVEVTAAPVNPQPLFIGGQGVENWRGFIDDVRIYDNAISADEIEELSQNVDIEYFAWFRFEEGSGEELADSSGQGLSGEVLSPGFGLADDGTEWVDDPARGSVISFDGDNAGTYVQIGGEEALPEMDIDSTFTWAFWARSEQATNNDIILGNRYDAFGADFDPREFVKFTTAQFEWHFDGAGQNIDYEDIPQGVWLHHTVVKDGANLTYYRNGVESGTVEVSGAPVNRLPLFIGGQGVENWRGLIDDVRIYTTALSEGEVTALVGAYDFPPVFDPTLVMLEPLERGNMLTIDLKDAVTDVEEGMLTFAKVSGPDWISISETGALSGTAEGDLGLYDIVFTVSDGENTIEETISVRIAAGERQPGLLAWWPLNEGQGAEAGDASGNGFNGEIFNSETGGLDETGSVWLDDPDRGMVLSLNGENTTGAWVFLGTDVLPVMTTENDFTWMFWANPQQAPNNDIIFGNRYMTSGADFSPREFIKFTSSQFEWHFDGGGENLDYDDLLEDEWAHHAVVKAGDELSYYMDGEFIDSSIISAAPVNSQPLYIGGQGVENWAGYLSDVRIYDVALDEDEVAAALTNTPGTGGSGFAITDIQLGDGTVELTWSSSPGASYAVDMATELSGWLEVTDSYDSEGESTTYVATVTPDVKVLYYRIRLQP